MAGIYTGERIVWSKPSPSADWPMKESIYDFADPTSTIGRLYIRKAAFERAERGLVHFHAFGLVALRDAGVGFVWKANRTGANEAIEVSKVSDGLGHIALRVDFSTEDYWRWSAEEPYALLMLKQFPKAMWVI